MKAFTDLKQSKKLAEFLPLGSADMFWLVLDNTPRVHVLTEPLSNYSQWESYPCWSLAALLSVLPSIIKRKGKRMFLTLEKAGAYNLYYKSQDRLDELWETKEEPIDACVELIETLHEQKLL